MLEVPWFEADISRYIAKFPVWKKKKKKNREYVSKEKYCDL